MHSDFEVGRLNAKTRTEPRLSKYFRRHHPAEQIIGNKDVIPMARNRVRNESCLLSQIETKIVRDALEDNGLRKDMEEEIEQIERK